MSLVRFRRGTRALLLAAASGCWFCLFPCGVETGAHWTPIADYPELQRLGYQFVVTTVSPDRREWERTFDAAGTAGLRLIVGMWPSPYQLRGDEWTITPKGVAFLRFAASRTRQVKAIFVYNEPYWIHPLTNTPDICGAMPAEQLRKLRAKIRSVWPEAKVYHDIGEPGAWAPGGAHRRERPCVGDKYTDATGVADYVGIWSFPFLPNGYRKSQALKVIKREMAYVRTAMNAEPVVIAQAFGCADCAPTTRWPTNEEIRDWNCALRSLCPDGVSWYVWQQDIYDEVLSRHPESWPATTAGACELGR